MTLPDAFPLIGHSVTLRRLRTDDLPAFQAYRQDPDVGRLQGWEPVPDDEALVFLDTMCRATPFMPGEWFQFGIAETRTDQLIGDLGVLVRRDRQAAELGISLRSDFQGRGLASEALEMAIDLMFDRTSIGSVVAITDERNTGAIRLVERVGMRLQSTQETEFRGRPCAELTFALARPEHGC